MTPAITWQSLGTSSNGWEFVFMAIEVQNGQHELFHPNPLKTFLVMESGLTRFTSYGVIAGARAADINTVSCTHNLTPNRAVCRIRLCITPSVLYVHTAYVNVETLCTGSRGRISSPRPKISNKGLNYNAW